VNAFCGKILRGLFLSLIYSTLGPTVYEFLINRVKVKEAVFGFIPGGKNIEVLIEKTFF